jgi:photosystem II stability/assembly factor-like uncharacterized protein
MNKTILHLLIISFCLINLKVNAQCTITVASDKDSLCEGLNHTITATNIPSGASIVWQKDGNDVLGNTTNTLTTNISGNYSAISTVSAPNNWVQINPLPQGSNLIKSFFLDSQSGWATTTSTFNTPPKLLKTTNGGASWSVKAVSDPNIRGIQDLYFIDNNNGWLNSGNLHKTSDGGQTWTMIDRSIYNYEGIKKMQFFNSSTGLLMCQSSIYKTIDGGISWSSIIQPSQYQDFGEFYFLNDLIGWASNYNKQIYKTIDGGVTWNLQFTGLYFIENIKFLNANTGWCKEGDYILRTTNGGQTWTRHSFPWYEYSYFDYHFFDPQNGILATYDRTFKTSNGGVTWITLPGVKSYAYSLMFVNNNIGYAVGPFGSITKTTNGGNTWISQSKSVTNEELRATYFIDSQKGWIGGYSGRIYKTINGGRSWINQSVGSNYTHDMYFINDQTGWAVGAVGQILRTTNGGTNWTASTFFSYNTIHCVFFRNISTGWAGGEGGMLIKTTDGGINWTVKPSGTSALIRKIFFISDLIGWAVGSTGKILKTIDGGETWVSQPSGYSAQTFNGVQFLDNQIGFIVGTDGVFLKTTNGGSNWIPYNAGGDPTIPYYFNDVHFIDAQKGWIVGPDIRKTVNGGVTWTMDGTNMALNKTLRACHFIDENNGFVVGNDGTIAKYSNTLSCSSNTLSINSKPNSPVITATISEIESGSNSILSSTGCTNGVFNWSSGQVGSPITVTPTITTNYTAKCFLNGCLSNSSNNLAISVYNSVYSIKSGNWDDPLTWSSNRVPTITDNITVRSNHTISLNIENALCRKLFLNTNANLTYENNKGLTVTK